MKILLLILRIIYLGIRIPILFIMGILCMMDGSAQTEIGYTYLHWSLLTGSIICVITIINFFRLNKNEWMLFSVLLLIDGMLFILISKSFPYSYDSFETQNKIYSLLLFLILILTVSGQILRRQK